MKALRRLKAIARFASGQLGRGGKHINNVAAPVQGIRAVEWLMACGLWLPCRIFAVTKLCRSLVKDRSELEITRFYHGDVPERFTRFTLLGVHVLNLVQAVVESKKLAWSRRPV